jgi:hypothetical protein
MMFASIKQSARNLQAFNHRAECESGNRRRGVSEDQRWRRKARFAASRLSSWAAIVVGWRREQAIAEVRIGHRQCKADDHERHQGEINQNRRTLSRLRDKP